MKIEKKKLGMCQERRHATTVEVQAIMRENAHHLKWEKVLGRAED